MKTHILKLQKDFCDAVFIGEKEFELRYNDRGFQKGDYVRFVPMDGEEEIDHPLIEELYEITYVLSGWGLQRNYVAFGIRNVAAGVPSHARMRPARFAKEMDEIRNQEDQEDAPYRAEACVADLLRQMGYLEGADIFTEIIMDGLDTAKQSKKEFTMEITGLPKVTPEQMQKVIEEAERKKGRCKI